MAAMMANVPLNVPARGAEMPARFFHAVFKLSLAALVGVVAG
jgi:hypothetical protein